MRTNVSTKRLVLLSAGLFIFSLSADEEAGRSGPANEGLPWFTGPLIAPSGYTVAPGHFNIEPYLFFNVYSGAYDNDWGFFSKPNFYNLTAQLQAKAGIVKGMDFQFYPQVLYNETDGHQYFNMGDIPTGINFQLLGSLPKDPWPAIKLSLKVNIPSGTYQRLDPQKKLADATGVGSWLPGAGLTISKLWHTSSVHYIDTRFAISYQMGTKTKVRGFNVYGGARDTRGTIYPGNSFSVDSSIQYSLTKQWAFACDFIYTYSNRNRFSGKAGTLPNGQEAKMRGSSNAQWSLAPAIEYNWNKNLGLIVGSWFSVAGRNTYQFASGVAAINIYL